MPFRFSRQSLTNLKTCDNRHQVIAHEALRYSPIDFSVLCGYRDKRAQLIAYQEGYSTKVWPFSKHNTYPSLAMDLAPWPIDWNDHNRFYMLAGVILAVSKVVGYPVIWGGNWENPKDLGHFELIKV